MDKREKKFWDWLSSQIGARWDAQRHEDKHSQGIPDVSYGYRGTQGWIELKSLKGWPRNGFPALSVEQCNWLTRRGSYGSHCWLLVEIKDVIVMFKWEHLDRLKYKTKGENEITGLARYYCKKDKFDVDAFLDIIAE